MSQFYKLNKKLNVSELCEVLKLNFYGNDREITGVAGVQFASSGTLTFANDSSCLSENAVVVATPDCKAINIEKCTHIHTSNARLTFVRLLDYLAKNIGFDLYLEPSKIAATAALGQNVVVESGCEIGEGVIIEPNVVIHKGSKIGTNTVIRSGATIGSDGFGFERLEDGTPIRFPHLGRVVIGNGVEIGSNTTVARGTLGDTKIDDYAKIDNLVHIAHNVHVKRGAFVTACAELSGGVVVGENAWIAPNVSTHQKISIGDNSIVGVGAVVVKDIPQNTVFAGNPARKLRDLN
ncbi:UDP-3-O-(3-hydroxymyristoyl)glucosamine N-acyltransferase [Pseudidiomarina donghaiensis]|uniref:UDP-3-O-(3-hydroxymyristoyl)glucosamine N-acyltransferase n=1 Tax=Pseudidiomarina donghaiensis TaxID=519452 RepID=A0A432XKV6_9GAMM|nr:UDP-3-O-(3-hydroxymyristoyl)glucosamine N-acyltransferase [Pseudidiomarina donghaiensis]RUO49327.1 UDP-3-O-(3-hydroxymyristoyl)glucosamine N-acyltransferase [Pseudidiomarina donghaiensis]SFV20998.1 UDP-3-O-[3-hydroxymyristoyl] glucosamine N-acyltransferase [Pseudidiomarina donghaiensis]